MKGFAVTVMLLFIGLNIIPCSGLLSSNNNVVIECILYDHDVGIKNITQPQGYIGDNIWIFFNQHYHPRNWNISNEDRFEAAIRMTPLELNNYTNWNLASVKFFHVTDISETHSGSIRIYDAGNSTSPGSLITSEPFTVTSEGWFEIELSSPVVLNVDEDVWVSVRTNCSVYELPVGNDEKLAKAGKGDWINLSGSWKELKDLDIDGNWCIKAGIEPEEQDIMFFQSGSQQVKAIVKNYGSYNETNLSVVANIFYQDKSVYQSNVTILQLDSGHEIEVSFDDWNFAREGIYLLEIYVSLESDEYLDNNVKSMYIGVDDTAPTSTHFFDPPISEWVKYGIGCNITITFVAIDFLSDVKEIRYSGIISGIIPGDYGSVIFELVESFWIEYHAIDWAGNEESINSLIFDLDLTPPEIAEVQWETYKKGGLWYVDFTASAVDAMSGMDRVEFYIAGEHHETIQSSGPDYVFTIEWTESFRQHTFWFHHFDKAGNVAIGSINGSDIEPYPYIHSYFKLFLRYLETFPIIHKILNIVTLIFQ